MTPHESIDLAASLLASEAAHLDARRFDEWLALYASDCIYWVPTWTSDETLADDPQTQLSHIYYASRSGLEDRIVRVRSGLSPASSPMPRTAHLLGRPTLREPASPERIRVEMPWTTQVFYPNTQEQHAFFGRSEADLELRGQGWLIVRKKIVLHNDYVPTMIDVYCL